MDPNFRWAITGAMFAAILAAPGAAAAPDSRPPGVYPGDPAEDTAPRLVAGPAVDRNLALRRAALHSSSHDYNLTAQLVTDGVKETVPPRWLQVSTHRGVVPKPERERTLDGASTTGLDLDHPGEWIRFDLLGGDAPPEIDRIELAMRPRRGSGEPIWGTPWRLILSGSDDGRTWRELGRASGRAPEPIPPPPDPDPTDSHGAVHRLNPTIRPSFSLPAPTRARAYRVTLNATGEERWLLSEVAFFNRDRRIEVAGPHRFSSAWMSEGGGPQWVSVDLGARSSIHRLKAWWLRRPAERVFQLSEDGAAWRDAAMPAVSSENEDDVPLSPPSSARYVRVLMNGPASTEGYVLTELEVWGRGGLVAEPQARNGSDASGRLDLGRGGWRLQRDSLVAATGAELSKAGFADADWIVATVPGTVLSSHWNVAAIPDPSSADNQNMISDSYFHADFWYRTEFEPPALASGERLFLSFDGVSWKAEVFLNGVRLGRVDGAFTRGRFDVTSRVRRGRPNALAVRVEKHRSPGSAKEKTLESPGQNGGALGADNPTFHASIGWDWIPTIRGRNIGLWNDVYLTRTGPVTIDSPFVRTTLPLPETSPADVRIEVVLVNHEPRPQRGRLRLRFGELSLEQVVELAGSTSTTAVLEPQTHAELRLAVPRLWWPNGYGEPHLYDVELELLVDGRVSDRKLFRAGLRQFTYAEENGALKIWVNGRRFVPRGGSWGFSESNLRYRRREYDAAVRYHRDMNFTMIRNWVGQTGDDELYDAADAHGIVIWQDFWLANPWDGPDPEDEALFLANVRDTLRRIRAHPSVGLYCGRNEGLPPPALESGIREALAELHPGIHYIPNSASGPVSGHGPYWAEAPRFYFERRATERLHSELGMPAIPPLESVRRFVPAASWPPDSIWGLHDFTLRGAQRLAGFLGLTEWAFGADAGNDAARWTELAQLVTYDGYRAMFEAQGRNRMGLLLWMSHPAWPSFVWQTYDYYLTPTAAYFGSKKGAEPLHIQWNPTNDAVEIVNHSGGPQDSLEARAEIFDLRGSVRASTKALLRSEEDSIVSPFELEYPPDLTPVHFIRLTLARGGAVVSENFYWRGLEDGDLRPMLSLGEALLQATTREEAVGTRRILTVRLRNTSPHPAILVRLSVARDTSGDPVLPVLFSDNFVSLMPGEEREIRAEVAAADLRGERPRIVVSGMNARAGD